MPCTSFSVSKTTETPDGAETSPVSCTRGTITRSGELLGNEDQIVDISTKNSRLELPVNSSVGLEILRFFLGRPLRIDAIHVDIDLFWFASLGTGCGQSVFKTLIDYHELTRAAVSNTIQSRKNTFSVLMRVLIDFQTGIALGRNTNAAKHLKKQALNRAHALSASTQLQLGLFCLYVC